MRNLKILDANELYDDNKFILTRHFPMPSPRQKCPVHETIEITHDPVIRSRKKIWP